VVVSSAWPGRFSLRDRVVNQIVKGDDDSAVSFREAVWTWCRVQRGREVSQLNLQYFGEELIVPSGALPLSFQAVRGGMML
jgi:hypothetical protein